MPICNAYSFKGQTGFSYLWMLLLVTLMGIALTISAELLATSARRDREATLLATGRQFQTAIERYYESAVPGGRKEYPNSLEDLLQDPRFPGIKRHLRKIPLDPITGKHEWGFTRLAGRIVAVHSLSEMLPVKQAGFDLDIAHFANAKKYNDWAFAYPPGLLATSLGPNGLKPVAP
jgi:type II secretory pathway pseudopilin PulG